MDDRDYPSAIAAMIAVVLCCTAGIAVAASAQRPSRLWPPCSATRPEASSPSFEWLGRNLRALLRQPAHPLLDRTAGAGLVLVVGLGFVDVGLAVVAAVGVWVRSVLQRRRATRRVAQRIGDSLADVIDLVAVALVSGGTVGDAVRQVGAWADDQIAKEFAWCDRQAKSGRALSDALEELPAKLGPQVRPLVAALVATERYGAPITTALAQLAIDTRADRRRRAEAAARRLPVALLFPLVVCVLPAFLLVTVVPVIFETVSNLDFSASP